MICNKDFYFIFSCAAPYEEPYKNDLDIALSTFRGFIKCLPNCTEKGFIIGDNMASESILNSKAYNEAYDLGKGV